MESNEMLPVDVAVRMLEDADYDPGIRPHLLPKVLPILETSFVFKEGQFAAGGFIRAREKLTGMCRKSDSAKPDRWHMSGGSKGRKDFDTQNAAVKLRRRYGSVVSKNDENEPDPTRWRFHLYNLMRSNGSGGDFVVDNTVAMYHVLPIYSSTTQPCTKKRASTPTVSPKEKDGHASQTSSEPLYKVPKSAKPTVTPPDSSVDDSSVDGQSRSTAPIAQATLTQHDKVYGQLGNHTGKPSCSARLPSSSAAADTTSQADFQLNSSDAQLDIDDADRWTTSIDGMWSSGYSSDGSDTSDSWSDLDLFGDTDCSSGTGSPYSDTSSTDTTETNATLWDASDTHHIEEIAYIYGSEDGAPAMGWSAAAASVAKLDQSDWHEPSQGLWSTAQRSSQPTHREEGGDNALAGELHRPQKVPLARKGERPHACPEPGCHYSAAQLHHLKTHMLRHRPDAAKAHGCREPGCGYRSNRKEHLTRHLRLRHGLGKAEHARGRAAWALEAAARTRTVVGGGARQQGARAILVAAARRPGPGAGSELPAAAAQKGALVAGLAAMTVMVGLGEQHAGGFRGFTRTPGLFVRAFTQSDYSILAVTCPLLTPLAEKPFDPLTGRRGVRRWRRRHSPRRRAPPAECGAGRRG
jgi:hypothetical protein